MSARKTNKIVRGISLSRVGVGRDNLLSCCLPQKSVPPSHAATNANIFFCGSPDFVNWSESGTLESVTVICIITTISVSLNHNNNIGYNHFLFSNGRKLKSNTLDEVLFMQLLLGCLQKSPDY